MTRTDMANIEACGHDAEHIAAAAFVLSASLVADPATVKAAQAVEAIETLCRRLASILFDMAATDA